MPLAVFASGSLDEPSSSYGFISLPSYLVFFVRSQVLISLNSALKLNDDFRIVVPHYFTRSFCAPNPAVLILNRT